MNITKSCIHFKDQCKMYLCWWPQGLAAFSGLALWDWNLIHLKIKSEFFGLGINFSPFSKGENAAWSVHFLVLFCVFEQKQEKEVYKNRFCFAFLLETVLFFLLVVSCSIFWIKTVGFKKYKKPAWWSD